MKKINYILMSLLLLCIMAVGVGATTVTVTAPSASGIVSGKYNFTATISSFTGGWNVSNCSFATSSDGVFNTTILGNVSTYWTYYNTSGLTETASTTITVTCYNLTGGTTASGTATTVHIDNANPTCNCFLGKSVGTVGKPVDYDCSASSDTATQSSLNYSCVNTYADASTETKTDKIGTFTSTFSLGDASVVCTVTDGASHTNTCSALSVRMASESVPEVITSKAGLSKNAMIVLLILVVAIIAVVAVVVGIKASKKRRRR